jgi:hypothetical protein
MDRRKVIVRGAATSIADPTAAFTKISSSLTDRSKLAAEWRYFMKRSFLQDFIENDFHFH